MSTEPGPRTAPGPTPTYDDAIVRRFLSATILWGIIALALSLFTTLELIKPTLGSRELAYGRLHPLYLNLSLFGFAANAAFTAIYYSTQRLCGVRMASDSFSRLHFVGWQLVNLAALATLPFGISQGKDYAELQWPIDLAILLLWLAFAVNFFRTLLQRREAPLYISLWFYLATIIIFPIPFALDSLPLFTGLHDAVIHAWYTHNSVSLLLTMPFLGLMYYFLPKAAERPLHSWPLAIAQFWTLVILYVWAAPASLHYSPLPAWASSLGMLFALMLWMPCWGALLNGLCTLRGAYHRLATDPALKFLLAGLILYGLATLEAPILAIKSISAQLAFTDWPSAHRANLGWPGLMAFGMIYWLLPRLSPRWSPRLATWHFRLALLGAIISLLSLYAGAFTQSIMWRTLNDMGKLQYPDFVESVAILKPLHRGQALGTFLVLLGAILAAINLFKSRRALSPSPCLPATSTRRLPRSTRWLPTALAAAILLQLYPLLRFDIPSNPSIQPLTPLELAGRDIYIAEGCASCHSQLVRPIWSETSRYGPYSEAAEFIHDRPALWGTGGRRIGPDLAREGGKQSHDWHIRHLENPRELVPQSIMPSFAHLLKEPLDFSDIPYRAGQKSDALARLQAGHLAAELAAQGGYANLGGKKVIALLAYLQRLGKDITQSPEWNPYADFAGARP